MAERRPPAGNLPADLTSFVGRRADLSQVRRLLSRSRLVTLTGAGGVGKSRLALRAGQHLSRGFRGGVWLVELASLQDGALLPQAVGQALGLGERAAGDPVEALCDFLARRDLLVVLDNCEHLVPSCQQLLTVLLRAAPGLRVLATSREVLSVAGEQVYEVAPLEVPQRRWELGPEGLAGYPGVELFAQRAAAVRPVFVITSANAEAVAQVCRLSEGIPLFLELAAAQLRSLSVGQLATRLEDRFQLRIRHGSAVAARHQSLRAAVEWSFTLCTPAERLVWVRASVFAGRFGLEAAEAVCASAELPAGEVLNALAGLIDKSVLVSGERAGTLRYWMLDTLRAFGLERLREPVPGAADATTEADLRRQHRDYYLGLAGRFDADWFGPRQVDWAHRLRAELPELRAALSFCLSTPGGGAVALRLAGALNSFWHGCGAAREGSLWLGRALAADRSPTLDRGRALAALTLVLTARSLHAQAAGPALECLELATQLGDRALLARAVLGRGLSLMHAGDLPAAQEMLDEAITRAAALPDGAQTLALATEFRAAAAVADGDLPAADAWAARCREVCLAHGDQCYLAYALGISMLVAFLLGDVTRTAEYGRLSITGSAALGDTLGLVMTLEFLAWTAAAEGDHRRAARLFGAADQHAAVIGGNPAAAGLLAGTHSRYQAAAQAALGAQFAAEFRTGQGLTLGEAVAYAQRNRPPQDAPRTPAPPHGDNAAPGDKAGQLTRREAEIARLIGEGMTNKQIAQKLVISQRTAEGHVENILIKLGLTTRTQIALWIVRHTSDRPDQGL